MRTKLTALLAFAALSACATPETRVRKALTNAGLSQPIASCMADRMVDRLSLGQLMKLNGLGKLKDKKVRELSIEEFVKRSKALQDLEIVGVVSSSALICSFKS